MLPADMQDLVHVNPKFLDSVKDGQTQVVYGVRTLREEHLLMHILRSFYYRTVRNCSQALNCSHMLMNLYCRGELSLIRTINISTCGARISHTGARFKICGLLLGSNWQYVKVRPHRWFWLISPLTDLFQHFRFLRRLLWIAVLFYPP